MEWKQRVAIRKTLGELADDRAIAVQLVKDCQRMMGMAEEKLTQNGSDGFGGSRLASESELITRIDSEFWRLSFKRTGMTQIMDAKAVNEFNASLERNPPEFTMDNIESQYVTMYQQADEMFLRGIYLVFGRLSWSYKTNEREPYNLSRKNILEYACSWWSDCSLEYSKAAMFNDMDRCVKVLTGRQHHPHELETRINDAMKQQTGTPRIYEDDDYHMKFFKNQNCHLTFKKQDTLDRLNDAIARYCSMNRLEEAA